MGAAIVREHLVRGRYLQHGIQRGRRSLEADLYKRYQDWFGYGFYVARKR